MRAYMNPYSPMRISHKSPSARKTPNKSTVSTSQLTKLTGIPSMADKHPEWAQNRLTIKERFALHQHHMEIKKLGAAIQARTLKKED